MGIADQLVPGAGSFGVEQPPARGNRPVPPPHSATELPLTPLITKLFAQVDALTRRVQALETAVANTTANEANGANNTANIANAPLKTDRKVYQRELMRKRRAAKKPA